MSGTSKCINIHQHYRKIKSAGREGGVLWGLRPGLLSLHHVQGSVLVACPHLLWEAPVPPGWPSGAHIVQTGWRNIVSSPVGSFRGCAVFQQGEGMLKLPQCLALRNQSQAALELGPEGEAQGTRMHVAPRGCSGESSAVPHPH